MRITYYCDMDGVVANFDKEPNAVERFKVEPDFFETLEPITANIEFIKHLVDKGERVIILSASPNNNADKAKKVWLKKHMPFIKNRNIIIMRVGQNKADFVKTKGTNILFDDYAKNVNEWNERANHIAIKVVGTIANSLKRI